MQFARDLSKHKQSQKVCLIDLTHFSFPIQLLSFSWSHSTEPYYERPFKWSWLEGLSMGPIGKGGDDQISAIQYICVLGLCCICVSVLQCICVGGFGCQWLWQGLNSLGGTGSTQITVSPPVWTKIYAFLSVFVFVFLFESTQITNNSASIANVSKSYKNYKSTLDIKSWPLYIVSNRDEK